MTIKQKTKEYNKIMSTYGMIDVPMRGPDGTFNEGLVYLPFTLKEYLDDSERCMSRYEYLTN
jgi:hypothetical protein